VTAGLGLLVAVGLLLANGSHVVPGGSSGGTPPPPDPLVFSVAAVGAESVSPQCMQLVGPKVIDVSVRSSNVRLTILPASETRVTRVFLTVRVERSISPAAYAKCAEQLGHSAPVGVPAQLPQRSSVVSLAPTQIVGEPDGVAINIRAPAHRRSTPSAYIWYVTVSATSPAGPIKRSSGSFATLSPAK
jgi:hypothetical protein